MDVTAFCCVPIFRVVFGFSVSLRSKLADVQFLFILLITVRASTVMALYDLFKCNEVSLGLWNLGLAFIPLVLYHLNVKFIYPFYPRVHSICVLFDRTTLDPFGLVKCSLTLQRRS
jgi:hypothetical protein